MFVYEYLVEKMRSPALQRPYHFKEERVEPLRTAVAGACAGMLSWLPGIPFDVIKTKMMIDTKPSRYKNVLHCFSVVTKVNLTQFHFIFKEIFVLKIYYAYFRSTATSIYFAVVPFWYYVQLRSVRFRS